MPKQQEKTLVHPVQVPDYVADSLKIATIHGRPQPNTLRGRTQARDIKETGDIDN